MKANLLKGLAIGGTLFVWIPVLAPLFFSLVSLAGDGIFRFDYLMPAEMFPVVLLGGILLIVAAAIAHRRRALIGSAFGTMIGILFVGQAIAVISGLATTTDAKPAGLAWVLVVASLVVYILALVVMGVGGGLLLGDLFRAKSARTRPA